MTAPITNCETIENYIGDGVQTDFTFSFETLTPTKDDIRVSNWNEQSGKYKRVLEGWDVPDSTPVVRFDEPPEAGQAFIIYRRTDITAPEAVFHPGHPIKADDLNDNFEQLRFAIKEGRCQLEVNEDVANFRFWERDPDSTIYSDNKWVTDDEHIATTEAIADRYDVLFLNQGENAPQGTINPGKFMLTADNSLFAWNGSQWFQPLAGGMNQAGEATSQHTSIKTNLPIANTYTSQNNQYSLMFSISALPFIPGYAP